MQAMRNRILVFVWPGFFLLLGYVAFSFAELDQLTSFADDGGSYLIMAKYFSPYTEVASLIEKAYIHESYPPLFPMLLAISGGAEDTGRAHQLIVLFFLISCVLYAIWASRVLGAQWLGLLACLIYALSPYTWPMLLRIVSEELYIALTLGVLLSAGHASKKGGYWLALLTALLTAVVLTRTIGVTLVIAWGAYLFFNRSGNETPWKSKFFSLIVPPMAAVIWHLSKQTETDHLYHSELAWLFDKIATSSNPFLESMHYLADQGSAMLDSWFGALMLVWQPDINPRVILASVLAVMIVIGWFIRIRRNQLDAWYSLFYVGLILIWPFPGQFFRFIVPLLPLFIVYVLQAAQAIGARYTDRMAKLAPMLAGIAFLVLTTPAMLLIYQRSQYPEENGFDLSSNPEFYQQADIRLAREKATQHLLLARDMDLIRTRTSTDATIMWFTPGYINLLAEREGMEFPNVAGREAMLTAIADNAPDYVYLSRLHPRKTSENGLEMLAWAGGAGSVVWKTTMPGTQDAFSVMLRVDH